MRHVSRTYRVSVDWLLGAINLNSSIQIEYVDTKNQLADILSKGSFTRDEWKHFFFYEYHEFLEVLLQPFLSNWKQSTMSKRG